MFVAYPLYVIHALLTGTSLALVNALGIHDGFGFSAGAIDYLLNFRIAQQPVLLLLIGLAYGVLYYFLFRFVIVKWNLHTLVVRSTAKRPTSTTSWSTSPMRSSWTRSPWRSPTQQIRLLKDRHPRQSDDVWPAGTPSRPANRPTLAPNGPRSWAPRTTETTMRRRHLKIRVLVAAI